ncbi:hypothetical protein ACEE21_14850 [Clostridium baratii]
MNILEVWIKDIVSEEKVLVDGKEKLKITFNTVCYGSKEVKTRIFDSKEDWYKFKSRGYYLA